MKTPLNKKLQTLFTLIEKERAEIIQLALKLSEEELNRKPAEGKWSVLQIIFHLVKTEKIIIISIQKQIKKKELHDALSFTSLKNNLMLNYFLKLPVKIPAPPIVAKVPETYDFNSLLDQWERARHSLKDIAEGVTTEEMKYNVFPHSYLGDMNIVKTFKFILEHIKHHKKQINKILSRI